MIDGRRFAILGLGRSARAVARVVTERGGQATCLDERPLDSDEQQRAVDQVQGMGADAITGWHGQIDASSYDVMVVSPGFRPSHPAIRAMRAASRDVWGEIEFAYRITDRPIVAITGTNGKSTVVVMTHLLIPGSTLAGNIYGSGLEEVTLTEAAAMNSSTPIVAEVSSFQLETIDKFRPRVASITNISPDHIDRHGSLEAYRAAKLRLFENMTADDTVVLPAWGPRYESDARTVVAEERDWPGIRVPATIGRRNASLAYAIALQIEAVPDAESKIADFPGLAHRLEWLGEIRGIALVNNSMCSNPAAFVSSGQSLAAPLRILAGGNGKGIDYGPAREWLAASGHCAYLFNNEPDELRRMFGDWPTFESMRAAFEAAMADVQQGETVILMPGCSSAPPYADFRERGDAFRALAEEAMTCAA